MNAERQEVVAMHAGGLGGGELLRFLDEGRRAATSAATPAERALRDGIALVDERRSAEAAAAFRRALDAGGPAWPPRGRTLDLLATALQAAGDAQGCADEATHLLPSLPRDRFFVDIAITGLNCAVGGGAAPWSVTARAQLAPLAREAMALPTATRDDRFQLYEALIRDADVTQPRGAAGAKLAGAWLDEIEATTPKNDDERTALDVARVRAATRLGTPERTLPALAASERAMPDNYTASARLASMALAAGRLDDAVAASRRGLARKPGAMGRSNLLITEGRALLGKRDAAGARACLTDALGAARAIDHEDGRNASLARIQHLLDQAGKPAATPKRGG